MTQLAISKHLKVLERAGLISHGRDAQRRPGGSKRSRSRTRRTGWNAIGVFGRARSGGWMAYSTNSRPRKRNAGARSDMEEIRDDQYRSLEAGNTGGSRNRNDAHVRRSAPPGMGSTDRP